MKRSLTVKPDKPREFKRPEYVTSFFCLPNEIIIHISSFDDWRLSGVLARLCKFSLRIFTDNQAIKEIVESYTMVNGNLKRCIDNLPRWLFFAIPLKMTGYYSNEKNKKNTAKYDNLDITDIKAGLDKHVLVKNWFATGGWMCQKIYGYQSETEIDRDIWVEKEDLRKFEDSDWNKRESHFDIVTADDEHGDEENIQRCLERFDLSVTQQGIKSNGEVYVTCASLYTLEYAKILVNVTEYTIDYTVNTSEGSVKANYAYRLRQALSNHYPAYGPSDYKHYNNFAFCAGCRYDLFEHFGFDTPPAWTKRHFQLESISKIKMWLTRLQKYCERFRNMNFIYVINDKSLNE